MIDGNFKKWSRTWGNRDNTIKVERSGSIYRDKESEYTEDLIIDIEIEEDDITETTITCEFDESEQYSDDSNSDFEIENTIPDFVNNQIIGYDRNGKSVKVNFGNKLLRIV